SGWRWPSAPWDSRHRAAGRRDWPRGGGRPSPELRSSWACLLSQAGRVLHPRPQGLAHTSNAAGKPDPGSRDRWGMVTIPPWLGPRRLRLASGLVLFAYLTTHYLNHALGLVSRQALDQGSEIFVFVWRNPVGNVLLYGALTVHMLLALWALYQRRSFKG